MAIVRVGGSTEVEVKEKKDRVDDALNATRAAVEEGIVAGGGVALLKAGKALDGLKGDNADQDAGIAIVRRALQAPIRQIAENAGVEGSIVVGKVLENASATFGFDAQTEEYVRPDRGRHHRPGQGRAHGPSGRRLGGRPDDHHRSGGRRSAQEDANGGAGGMPAAAWAAWAAWATWTSSPCLPPHWTEKGRRPRAPPFFFVTWIDSPPWPGSPHGADARSRVNARPNRLERLTPHEAARSSARSMTLFGR